MTKNVIQPLPVPTKPEPLATLQARYGKALEHTFDAQAIKDEGAIRPPGEVPDNVFDFEDGLRLIISRERLPDDEIVLHISASLSADSHMSKELRARAILHAITPTKLMEMWCAEVQERFAELSGSNQPLHLVGFSDSQVAHWIIRENQAP